MSLSTIEKKSELSDRILRLKSAVQQFKPSVCPERALLWTEYYKDKANQEKPAVIQMAEALRHVLLNKSITIYDDELIVGNYTSYRVGGSIYPELHGLPMMEDIFTFPTRKVNPLQLTKSHRNKLLSIIPFWLTRFLSFNVYDTLFQKIAFMFDQLQANYYLINETGGIAHLAPDYSLLIQVGCTGIQEKVAEYRKSLAPGDHEKRLFYDAVHIIADGLARFGERYAELASQLQRQCKDPQRLQELKQIEDICRRVPRYGARTFREALQSLFFAQIALNLESLDNAICPGRVDHYCYEFYRRDLEKGELNREQAQELLAALSIKMSEIIPVFSQRITRIHGGMFNGQVITVGGQTPQGEDSTNELSMLFLEVMDALRMRQPNFHARIHSNSPIDYRMKIMEILREGSNSPALYNDDAIIPALMKHGYTLEDARDYTAVGCVEPVAQGKSFASTDAALMNGGVLLELALNRGKRFGSIFRTGARTAAPSAMHCMDNVVQAFESQLQHFVSRLIRDLRAVERANAVYHPTPLTSMLLEGCIAQGCCSTRGGAKYNFSGVQLVGPADVGDSLYAIEEMVFKSKELTLPQLVDHLKQNFVDDRLRAMLASLPKFGNDIPEVDRWTVYVIEAFHRALEGHFNTRKGAYVPGLYSVTAHKHFGSVTGAMPHGRKKGEAFASGIAPINGGDRKGPTALLNSVNRIPMQDMTNGINLNLKFDCHALRGEAGVQALLHLIQTYFRKGGLQTQVNVLDPAVLEAARRDPQLYPNLLVRVSGYSAYFNDLTPEMKDDVIRRTWLLQKNK